MHLQHHNRTRVVGELATLAQDLFDALRQGPMLGALVLLVTLLAIQVLVGQAAR